MRRRISLRLAGALAGFAFVGGLRIGAALDPDPPAAEASRSDRTFRALDVLTEVYGHIQRNYVEPVEPDRLVYSAIDGMVQALDPHSEFLSPDHKAALRSQARGEFPGVGMEIGLREGELRVIAPLPGAPADRAGLRPGDALRAIDGRSTRGLPLGEAVRLLRGEAGTVVELRVGRGEAPPFTVQVERAVVRIDPVQARLLPDGSAHVRVVTFQRDTEDRLRAALVRLRADAGGALPGIVLDLRNNPGGLLNQAIAVADLFLGEGQIVSTRGRAPARAWQASTLGTLPPVPVVVVVNAGTASAAEIVAGALQAHRRAVVVGTPTFGKGSVQSIYDLTDGSGLKLTVAHYFTPDGRSIQARGLAPDVYVAAADAVEPPPPAQREADLDRRLANPDPAAEPMHGPPPRPADPVLARAVEVLRVAGIFSRRP